MDLFRLFAFVIVIFTFFTQIVLSGNVTNVNPDDDGVQVKDPKARRMFIINNSAKGSNGQHSASHKVETKTFTTHVSTSGSGGSEGLRGWVSSSQSGGTVILNPQMNGIVQSQEGCGSETVPTNTGDLSLNVQKTSTVENSQAFNGGNSLNSLTFESNQWQSNQNDIKEPYVEEQFEKQSSILQETTSQLTNKDFKDLTRTETSHDTQGFNTVYHGATNAQKEENSLYPDNSYNVSLSTSGDEIYANEISGQQLPNLNVMVPTELNAPNILAVPVLKPQFGRVTVQGYRPNIQYYLSQIETGNLIRNPSAVQKQPYFIEHIKPGQLNIHLSDEQLNLYKQYLIQTGLIQLKPYQLIFSDQFRPKLRTLQWMVVPLESNYEYCKQRCRGIFPRDTLYSTISENISKLPLKLLVPVLKIRSGIKKTIAGAQTIAGGVGDVSNGMYRIVKEAPSNIIGLVMDKSGGNKTEN